MSSDRAIEQFRDERIGKLEKRFDALEKTVNEKLIPTNTQISEALDRIGKSQEQLRLDFKEALATTQKTISEATVDYIDRRMTGQSVGAQGIQSNQPKRGGLDGLFDRIGPTIDRVLDRYGNSANLPFLQPSQPELNTEIVDLERQVKNVTTAMYRNELRGVLNRVNAKLGLPSEVTESVRVGASHA
jgi:hypothetical protein